MYAPSYIAAAPTQYVKGNATSVVLIERCESSPLNFDVKMPTRLPQMLMIPSPECIQLPAKIDESPHQVNFLHFEPGNHYSQLGHS